MKPFYRVLFILLILLGTQWLLAQSLPNPKITSSFTPDTSCVSHDPRQGGGSAGDGKAECLYACENHPAMYCTSAAPIDTFKWTVVGGTIGGNATITGVGLNCVTVLWGPAGSGTLSVTQTDTGGNTGNNNTCIKIINSPVAGFTPLNASACLGTAVNFNDASFNAMSWIWNFGDPASGGNNTTVLQNPSHIFSAPGTYTVTLVVFNACGCSDSTTGTVTVTNLSGPKIDCPSTVCAGTSKCYSTPDGCPGATYTWTVVGGTRLAPFGSVNNICVQWGSGNPQGSISLSITGCGSVCPGPTTVTIPIVPTTSTIAGSAVACFNSTSVYSLPAWPGTCYNWTVPPAGGTIIAGDSTNHIQVHWTSLGTFPVNVSWHNDLLGCAPGSATIMVTVNPELTMFGPTGPVCLNSTSSFFVMGNPATPSTNFTWSATGGTVVSGQGTQNATVQWTSPGLQTVTATPVGSPNPYCTPNQTYTVNVVQVIPPVSITGPVVVCPNGTFTYTTPAPPSGLDIQWTATNGTIVGSDHANPVTVTWGPSGPYSVSVSYVNTSAPFCASVPFTLPVNVFNVAAITGSTNVCMDQTTTFTAGALFPGIDYQWSIVSIPGGPVATDGSIVSGQNTNQISVLWHGPGSTTVYVQLTACNITLTLPVTINPKPTPTITKTGSLCNPVILTASAGFVSYAWSNGATGNPIAVTTGGNYTVTVTNAAGCTATATINVPQPPGPTASISTPDRTAYCPLTATINTKLYALQGTGYTYLWSNGFTGNPMTATLPGTYTVTVTDANGCTAVSNPITITLDSCVTATGGCSTTDTIGFTINTPICNPVTFNGAFSPTVTGQSWNFGDPLSGANNTSNLVSPTHTFTQAGYYVVTYSGAGQNSSPPPSTCAILATHSVAIPLAADFSYVIACAGSPTVFTDHSTYLPPFAITGYSWNFGDPGSGPNNTSTLANPTHIFNPGTYTVTLTVTNGTCTVIQTKTFTINPLPSAAFILPSSTCVGTDIAMSATVPGLTYAWAFGDGATSALQNTSHAFTTTGTYNVTLTVTDNQGCSNTISQPITIVPPVTGCLISPAGPVTLCPNQLPYMLTAPSGTTYQWFQNGSAIAGPGGTGPTLSITVAGNYAVEITNANGCKCKTPPVTVVVNPKPIAAITVTPSQLVCLGSGSNSILLTTPFGPGTYDFTWFKDGNPVGTGNFYSETFGATGIHIYAVHVTDTVTGCKNIATMTITVCTVPAAPTISASGSTNLCQGDSVTLTSSIGAPDILWSTGQTTQSITVYASGTYTVTYTDPGCGCKSTASIMVKVYPYPDFSLFPTDSPNCCDKVCDTAHICAPRGYLGYQWQLNGINIPGPLGNAEEFTPPASGSYTLILTGPNGCTDTSKPYCLVLEKCTGDCVDPPSDMVAWWPLNDPNAGVLDSEIVGFHNGVPKPGPIKNYPAWTAGFGPSPASTVTGIGGKVGDALYFFGQTPTRGYIDVPHSSAITFATSDMSIDAWVYIDNTSGGIQPIVDKMANTLAGGMAGYRLYLNNGLLTFDVAPASPGSIQYATPLTPNLWHHVVATLKRSATPYKYTLFVDGAAVTSTTISSIGNLYETANLIIGRAQSLIEVKQLPIAIDELEFFKRALDSTQVYSLWHADSKGKCRTCIQACEGTITGTKWLDKNHNGRFDQPEEQGLPNWTIAVVSPNPDGGPSQDTIATTVTDNQGNYTFPNLCPGQYTVVEAKVPGWQQTWPIEGFNRVAITAPNQVIGNINFGNWNRRISLWNGVISDPAVFDPSLVFEGSSVPWPIVIAQLNPYQVVFKGIYDGSTELNLSPGDYSIRRKRVTNYTFGQVVVNGSVLSDGSMDSVIVTLPDDPGAGVSIGFVNIGAPDATIQFRTFTADQLAQTNQAKPIAVKKGQTTFAANTANLIAQIIKQGGKFVVGKAGQLTAARKVAAYLAPAKQSDVFATFNTKNFVHTQTPHGLDFDFKGGLLLKLQKSLPAKKHNNKLLADMLALEINIITSDQGVTPQGFGDLVVLDSLLTTDHRRINPNGTIRELADSINEIMTNWHGVSADIYENLDNIVAHINAAFAKPLPLSAMDTASWQQGKNLKLNGATALAEVPFLLQVSGSAASGSHTGAGKTRTVPTEFALYQNYPNPFNPVTVLNYDLPVAARVTLTIYNTLGQAVERVVDETQDAGFKTVQWNAANMASGVYFYRLEATSIDDPTKSFMQVKKMLLVR